MHALYKKARNLDRASEEFLEIRDEMFKLSDQIKISKGVESI